MLLLLATAGLLVRIQLLTTVSLILGVCFVYARGTFIGVLDIALMIAFLRHVLHSLFCRLIDGYNI